MQNRKEWSSKMPVLFSSERFHSFILTMILRKLKYLAYQVSSVEITSLKFFTTKCIR